MYRTESVLLTLVVLLAASAFAAEEVKTTAGDETISTTMVPPPKVDEGRFFVTNWNTTSVQVSAISVIGATLIGIAIALAIGGLLPVFSGAVGGAGVLGAGGLGKRSVTGDEEDSGLMKVLSMLGDLRDLDVADVDCQKKVVCEVQRQGVKVAGTNVGQAVDKMIDVLNSLSNVSDERDDSTLLRQYRDASRKGKAKQDCEAIYSTCKYAVRKVIRSLAN